MRIFNVLGAVLSMLVFQTSVAMADALFSISRVPGDYDLGEEYIASHQPGIQRYCGSSCYYAEALLNENDVDAHVIGSGISVRFNANAVIGFHFVTECGVDYYLPETALRGSVQYADGYTENIDWPYTTAGHH